jgi:hypothetical protein
MRWPEERLLANPAIAFLATDKITGNLLGSFPAWYLNAVSPSIFVVDEDMRTGPSTRESLSSVTLLPLGVWPISFVMVLAFRHVRLDSRRPSTIDVTSLPAVLWDSAIVAMPTVPVSLAGVPIPFRKRSRIPGRGSKSVLKGHSQLLRSERFNSPSGATPPPVGWNSRRGEGDSFLQNGF